MTVLNVPNSSTYSAGDSQKRRRKVGTKFLFANFFIFFHSPCFFFIVMLFIFSLKKVHIQQIHGLLLPPVSTLHQAVGTVPILYNGKIIKSYKIIIFALLRNRLICT
jgi:hypothetical protein